MTRRSRLLPAMLLFFVATVPPPPARSADGDLADAPPSVGSLIADLDSDEYAVRKKATRGLIAAGSKSVGPLTAAAQQGTLEVRIRVIRILQELYAGSHDGGSHDGGSQDDKAVDAAELALETLAESGNRSLSARAEQVLNTYYDRRQQRALTQIERLGGVINYRNANIPQFPQINADPNKKQIAYVLLGSRWKGGDAGLKYVKRLSRLGILYLSGAGNAGPISKEAEQSLQAALPNLIIQRRGAAYLGIGGGAHPRGCQVLQVKAGAAAAKAGFREFDVITGFGGKKIADFDTLIAHIKNFSPGDKVKVKVLRGTAVLTLEVVMGEWK